MISMSKSKMTIYKDRQGEVLMKKILFFAVAVIMCACASAFAADEATSFVRQFTDEALNGILAKPVSLEKKADMFGYLFEKCTSLDTIASFALGRKIKSLSPEEKERFKKVFKENLILMWTLRFAEYNDQHFEFVGEKVSDNGKDVFVSSKVVSADNVADPPIDVVWRIRKDKNGKLMVIDIVISNISMLKTYQTEYASFLNRNGGDINELISLLESKNTAYRADIKAADTGKKS